MSGIFSKDELDFRPGKNIAVSHRMTDSYVSMLRSITSGSPQVMIKLTPAKTTDSNGKTTMKSPHDKASLKTLVNYMGKDGNKVTDERGNIFAGSELDEATEDWQGLRQTGGKYREVFHIIMSMPSDTPEGKVKIAIERFAAVQFEGHQYLIAHHRDTARPHAHIALKVRSIAGKRMKTPDKFTLQSWREGFVYQLGQLNIDAAATSREERISTRNNLSQNEYQWSKKQGDEFLQNRLHRPPTLKEVVKARQYIEDADYLDNGTNDDREIANGLRNLVNERFPPRQQSNEHTL